MSRILFLIIPTPRPASGPQITSSLLSAFICSEFYWGISTQRLAPLAGSIIEASFLIFLFTKWVSKSTKAVLSCYSFRTTIVGLSGVSCLVVVVRGS